MNSKMNYFNTKIVAENYDKGRPDFHNNTLKRIKNFLKINDKLENALDVACGTGLSTKILLNIAKNVFGSDISEEMLNIAKKNKEIKFFVSQAETQPFENNFFDLVTISSGIHWFDIDKFLTEMFRILKEKGWIIIYENYFISEMEGFDNFKSWFPDVYLKKFPSPPRNNIFSWSDDELNKKGFNLENEEHFKNEIIFTKESLILYLTTQSNIIANVEKGISTYEQIREWLNFELEEFFPDNNTERLIKFGNWIKFLQKMD